jgi:hypothetical protein
MPEFYLIGKLGESPRGRRLIDLLPAAVITSPPDGVGVCLGSGQDYQGRTPAEQRQWLQWAANPGCVLLLVPPYQTGAKSDPDGWEFSHLDSALDLDSDAHEVLRLTRDEIAHTLKRGLAPTRDKLIDGGVVIPLHGLYRKHPDSGIFAVTAVPVWSLALVDRADALSEWLCAWHSLAGRPRETDAPRPTTEFEPSQSHYSVLLYLASDHFQSRVAALSALDWNDVFELGKEDIASLLDELEAAGMCDGVTLTDKGRESLMASPFRPYAEAYLNPGSHS